MKMALIYRPSTKTFLREVVVFDRIEAELLFPQSNGWYVLYVRPINKGFYGNDYCI